MSELGVMTGQDPERGVGRRTLLRAGGTVVAGGFAASILSACGANPSGSRGIDPKKIGGTLNLVAWKSYEGDGVIDAWRKEQGLTIKESPLSSNDQILTQLRAGGLGKVDLVTPNVSYAPLLLAAGVLQPIDYSKIPNTKNILPAIATTAERAELIDGKHYALPYLWGYDGMVYNSKLIPTAPGSWMDVMKPEYKGKVVMISGVNPNFEIWPRVLGYDAKNLTKDQLVKVVNFLKELKKQCRLVTPDPAEAADVLARGDAAICASGTFFGLPTQAPEGDPIKATLPKEGGATWIDCWAIAAKAPNLDSVYGYLDKMLSVPVQVTIGTNNLEGTVNSLAVSKMPEGNTKLFGYKESQIGSAQAPLFEFSLGGESNLTDYADWQQAWGEVQSA